MINLEVPKKFKPLLLQARTVAEDEVHTFLVQGGLLKEGR